MPLTDKPPTNYTRGVCGIAKLNLPEVELDALNSWMGHYSDQSISDRLHEEGHPLSRAIVEKHRRQKCACYR